MICKLIAFSEMTEAIVTMVRKTYHTIAYTKISDYLKSNRDRCVTVNDIMNNLRSNSIEITPSTVYRCLGRMSDSGCINKYVSGKGEMALYQYVDNTESCEGHIHLQCVRCGLIIHLNCDFMGELSSHIEDHHGFSVICKGSVLYGLCNECKGVKDNEEE